MCQMNIATEFATALATELQKASTRVFVLDLLLCRIWPEQADVRFGAISYCVSNCKRD